MAKNNEYTEQDILFENQKIVDIDIEKEVKKSFIEYAMSVIMSRALPDARDGMKPGQRRILYAMYEDNLTYDKPYRKSATTVGNVLGRYHPHGDAAVYGTMVRFAQKFSMRHVLVDGQGNFGSVDGDGAAAYRYTEARMSKIADYMMRDIEKKVVDFMPNFDNKLMEPTVLPSKFPNLLVNGAIGIAVGMATNIPTHNLAEVIDATICRIDNPECTLEELMQHVKGPDFPTAATIYGTKGIEEAYRTGKGHIMVRAKAEIEEDKHRIIITEIPYQVNKKELCIAMANLVKDKRIEGIRDIRDESGKDGMRIVVEFKNDANGQVILNQLYKYTQLQDTCAVNMLALVNNEPKILSLPEILDIYIAHQEQVIERRTKFDLDKALARAHILEGYKIAIANIDEVVEIMKTSESIPNSKERLMERFGLTDAQSQAIVEMTLGRLTGLETKKIEDELDKLNITIADLRDILANEWRVKAIIKDEMTEIKDKFGEPRRTDIVEATDEIDLEDLIERHTCVITMTNAGYIKRQPVDEYAAQNRGGVGKIGMTTKENDFIDRVVVMNSHAYLMLFTNTGRVYTLKAYRVPEASRTAKGSNIVNILDLREGERITSLVGITGFADSEYLTMVTKNGVIKKTLLSEFEYQRKGGKIAIGLDDDDELLYVVHTKGESDIIIASHDGQGVRFSEQNVRAMGRPARGVRGMTLREGDFIKGTVVVEEGKKLLTVTEKGKGKRSEFADFRSMKNRGGTGYAVHNITEDSGKLAGILAVSDDDDVMVITDEGVIIRTGVDSINVYSRTAGGVKVMNVEDDAKIIGIARIENEAELEKAAEEAEAATVQEIPDEDAIEMKEPVALTEETSDEE